MGVLSKAIACAALVGLATAQCTVSDGTRTFDLNTIPAADSLKIKQVVRANPALNMYFNWAVSVCAPAAPVAPRSCAKAPSSYLYEYKVAGDVDTCVQAMPTASAPWSWDASKNAATRTFNGVGVRAVVDITCDPTADVLTVNGDAPTEMVSGTWVWNLRLKSKAVCASATPAPSAAPAPAPGPYGFHYCGAVAPAKVQVRGQTAQPVAIISGVGSQLKCTCLTVASNTSVCSYIKLSVACGASPQGPFAMVKELAQNTGYSAEEPVTARCPVRGYFAVVAWNPSGFNAALDYGASCTVSP